MSTSTAGRHRTSGRLNPFNSLSSAVARSARPAITATASAAAAGSMVIGLAATANASPAANPQSDTVAEAPVVSGPASSPVTYGLQIVTPSSGTSMSFTATSLRNRTSAARAAAVPAQGTVRTDRTPARAPQPQPQPNATPAPPPATGGVLGIAASLSGIPYRWGGTTPAGFDCSGFVQYVYARVGISLPRTAGAQRAVTAYVSNPVPGDLVFFGTYHVGIYAGNGMMYDSPTSGQTTGLHKIWGAVTYGRVG